jgi:hypothetical protein
MDLGNPQDLAQVTVAGKNAVDTLPETRRQRSRQQVRSTSFKASCPMAWRVGWMGKPPNRRCSASVCLDLLFCP